MTTLKIEQRPITSLKPYSNNPRNNQKAVEKVANSISHYGFRQPIVVDKDNIIIVGHTRFEAAKRLGFSEVPVHVADNLNATQIRAYRLADNRTAEEATWDMPALKVEFEELQALPDIDLRITGFSQNEINDTLDVDLNIDDSEHIPDSFLKPPVTQSGDIWVLGKHRVMCGDSTKWQDVSKLIEHNRIDLIFTDPPYNINYTGGIKGSREIMANDSMDDEEFYFFLKSAFENCVRVMQLQASAYVCHPSVKQIIFQHALEASGLTVKNQIVWTKSHFTLSGTHYKPQHELIFFGGVKNQSVLWYGGLGESTVWATKKATVNVLHPTMKPLELMLRAIHNSSARNDTVFDCFGGSGSTLIACENSERNAFLMEISPHYVDTIIRRWQSQTKQQAYLIGNGLIFDEICESTTRENIKVEEQKE